MGVQSNGDGGASVGDMDVKQQLHACNAEIVHQQAGSRNCDGLRQQLSTQLSIKPAPGTLTQAPCLRAGIVWFRYYWTEWPCYNTASGVVSCSILYFTIQDVLRCLSEQKGTQLSIQPAHGSLIQALASGLESHASGDSANNPAMQRYGVAYH